MLTLEVEVVDPDAMETLRNAVASDSLAISVGIDGLAACMFREGT